MVTVARETHDTLWVCVDCYLDSQGMLDPKEAESADPPTLALVDDGAELTAGLIAEEHDDECPVWLGDPDRPDVPVAGAECECERITFTWSACHGCGSTLGGSREALTVWWAAP
jgi:hypothetical protein